jgi:hypothetical protein
LTRIIGAVDSGIVADVITPEARHGTGFALSEESAAEIGALNRLGQHSPGVQMPIGSASWRRQKRAAS